MVNPGTREWDEAIWAAGAAGIRPDWADVAWYGMDAHGLVGMFTSGGPGPIPRAVFRNLDTYDALGRHLCGLSVLGKPEVLIPKGCTTDWKRAAERGLFAFDYTSDGKRPDGYWLVARPSTRLSVVELPEWVRAELSESCLQGESFDMGIERVADLSGIVCRVGSGETIRG